MIKKLESKIHVVERFKLFGLIGLIFALIGAVSLVLLPFGVNFFNLDIDFQGGTTMTINMHKYLEKADLDNIESLVENATGVKVSSVQRASSEGYEDGSLVVVKSDALSPELRDKAYSALKEVYGLVGGVESDTVAEGQSGVVSDLLSCDSVDPIMGNDLRNAAIISASIAILLMLVYIAFRFEIRSGIAAVVALLHDVLVVISSYVIFRIPLNMTFIAVVLTIFGYSINATIVIFDRVRENKRLVKRTSFADLVNKSVWQTATRSINTTITTLLSIAMIAIFGVTSVRNFAIPLIVGVIAGLYSSVFISGPVWVKLAKNSKKR